MILLSSSRAPDINGNSAWLYNHHNSSRPPLIFPGDDRTAAAASLGVALATGALALWGPDGMGLTATPDAPAPKPEDADGRRASKTPVFVLIP
ncbi:hypothetical protein SAMD00023353_2501260 [Rosellinia necatrix]|uniref:Uncharacterized protein n=1 Tax=Rosellinia necatrix TaxID=77044 RepID=A0A1S8A8B9_ROSNE|nr:hypothetical protein SAMD00023353_2501260 [Rosellinia necatrix]